MDIEYICRLSSDLSFAEVEDIRKLYVEVYGEKIGSSPFITALSNGEVRPWEWKFADAYRRPSELMLAYDGERLIGHTAILPHRARFANIIVTVGQGLDSMISPEYQKKGIFTAMSNAMYGNLSKDIAFLYAFPNKNNYVPRLKLSWMKVCEIPWYEKPVEHGHVSNNVLEVNTMRGIDSLWRKISRRMGFSIIRDVRYLSWRFVDNPMQKYCIYVLMNCGGDVWGYAIWKLYGKQAQIVDAAAIEPNILKEVISHLEYHCSISDIDSIAMFVPNEIIGVVDGWGFRKVHKDVYYMVRSQGMKICADDIGDAYIQMSDNDIF